KAAKMWPSRWLTPTSGRPVTQAGAFGRAQPTRSEPTRPGPCVTAIPSRSPSLTPARASASSTTGTITSRWRREANSGTTPPYGAWTSSWEATTLDRIRRPSATTAAAVSSQELSMPRTFIAPVGGRERPRSLAPPTLKCTPSAGNPARGPCPPAAPSPHRGQQGAPPRVERRVPVGLERRLDEGLGACPRPRGRQQVGGRRSSGPPDRHRSPEEARARSEEPSTTTPRRVRPDSPAGLGASGAGRGSAAPRPADGTAAGLPSLGCGALPGRPVLEDANGFQEVDRALELRVLLDV